MGTTTVIRVLIADDHPVVREGINRLLSTADDIAVVGMASTAEACIEEVLTQQPDLLLLDMAMPDMDGLEVIARLRESHPNVRVLVFSGYADDAFVFGALDAGAAGYLLKEEMPGQITHAVRAALRGEVILSDTIAQKVARRAVQEGINPEAPALSERELAVLQRVAQFKTNKEMAAELSLSERTVEYHVSNLLSKVGKGSRRELARWAWEKGLATL